ncbi:synaptonemal complex protein 3-like [Thomomys bottae]
MAPKQEKHRKKGSKATEPTQYMASNSSQNPANYPAIQSSGDIDSFLAPEDEVRIELKKIIHKFQENIRKKLFTKRSLKMKINAFFKSIQKKWDHVLKGQHDLRMTLYGKDIQEMVTLFLLSDMQLNRLKEGGENLATLYLKQEKFLQQSLNVYSQEMEALVYLYDQNLKAGPLSVLLTTEM